MSTEPKKSKHLQEVEEDAIRIQTKRFRDMEEERQYQAEKRLEEEVKAPEVAPVVKPDVKSEPVKEETKPEVQEPVFAQMPEKKANKKGK